MPRENKPECGAQPHYTPEYTRAIALQADATPLPARFTLDNGLDILVREIRPDDEPRVKRLFDNLSRDSLYTRFLTPMTHVPDPLLHEFACTRVNDIAIAALLPHNGGEEIVALAGYCLNKATNRAEVSFAVLDALQHHGIGTLLFHELAAIARTHRIAAFTAEVFSDNRPMHAIFSHGGVATASKTDHGITHYEMAL